MSGDTKVIHKNKAAWWITFNRAVIQIGPAGWKRHLGPEYGMAVTVKFCFARIKIVEVFVCIVGSD